MGTMDTPRRSRPPYAVESQRLRVQRFGAPRDTGRLLARLLASVAVAVGVVSVSTLLGTWAATAMVILGALVIVVGSLASVPLLAGLLWLGLFAVFARTRSAALYVGRSLCVERGRHVESFAPADVVSVAYEPGRAAIRLEGGDEIRAEVGDPHEIERIAAAVADSGARGPWLAPLYARAPARSLPRSLAIGLTALAALAAIVALALGSTFDAFGALVGCVGMLLWLTILRPGPERRRVAIGADGIDLRGETGRRFIPFSAVARFESTLEGAVLVLAGGEHVPLAVVPPARMAADPDSPVVALGLRRRAAMLERLQAGSDAGEALAGEERLARQGRTVSAWRDAVRDLVSENAPGYRVALLPSEQAARIVEKGHATPEARIGAALALAGSADAALKERLRIAIDDCADEATQTAIAQALEDRLDPWALERLPSARVKG